MQLPISAQARPAQSQQIEPLSRAFNVCVNQMATRLFPKGFDVSSDAPETFEALKEHVARTGRMMVSDQHCDKTVFECAETNMAFRAWHDHCHLRGEGHEFTTRGEYSAYKEMVKDVRALYGKGDQALRFINILYAEIMGQLRYMEAHDGEFPTNQRAFVEAFLANYDWKVIHLDF